MPDNASKSRRREHILRVAEQLFQHYGFTKTTVADIARAAEVGVGTVYLEFRSKEDIASALSVKRYGCVLAAMRAAAESEGSYAERLLALFQARLARLSAYAHEGPHSKELIRGACMATDQAHARFCAEEEDLLAGFLSAAAESGEFRVPAPRDAARVILRLYQSFSYSVEPDRLRDEIETAQTLLLRGLLAR